MKPGIAWAWAFGNELCHWAEPDRARLLAGGKPTPEAVPVAVYIVPRKSLRKGQRKGEVSDERERAEELYEKIWQDRHR